MQPLPDALRGEKWAFVQLPLSAVLDMLKKVEAVRTNMYLSCACCAQTG